MSHAVPTLAPDARRAAPAGRRRWGVLVLLCLAQFMLILDVTVVNVALPSIGTGLRLGREALTWVVTAYTLCFGGLMLLGGRLADALGARRTLLAGLVIFTAASLTAGLAGNGTMLIASRVAQGVGAALLSPSALAIITTTFHGPERARALGVWAALGGAGSAVGVLLGGALTAGPGWAWVFRVNVPVGIVVLAALPALIPAEPATHRRGHGRSRVDLPGAVLVTGGTAALIYALVKAGDAGWGSRATLVPLALAAVAYAGFAAVERASRAPLMDLGMLTRRPVVSGAFLMLVATALLIGFSFLGSIYLQHTRGFSALKTGLVFLPVAAATLLGAHTGSRLVGSVGGRPVAAAGLALAATGSGLLTRLSATGNALGALLPGFMIAAAGIGAAFVAAATTALSFVPPREAGVASGLVNTFHEVGGSVGVATVSTVAGASIEIGTVDGFTAAFTVCAIVAATAALVTLILVPAGRPTVTVGPHGY
jgi:EmrB/QacA subfamily drug resistance transporter